MGPGTASPFAGCFAHSKSDRPTTEWQPLTEHLRHVAERAAEFAAAFNSAEWGRAAGWLHDLGKASPDFQRYLSRPDGEGTAVDGGPGKVDHSSAGAQMAVRQFGLLGHLLAYAIAGHHSGLLDGRHEHACQEDRLTKGIPPLPRIPPDTWGPLPALPSFLRSALAQHDAFAIAFFVRMLYSCLVDADSLDTEAFTEPDRAQARCPLPEDVLSRLERALDEHLTQFPRDDQTVNLARRSVRAACLARAALPPGFFSLTVPTGGGKTLSSLAFALRHAVTHGLSRVVYVIPFTSIIEQNAEEFRRVTRRVDGLPLDRLVVEHHSGFDPDKETLASRLACEDWDAPLIVTTSVQFYESLFANRSSACRKLHNLARSVVILDEAQVLPVELLQPCLRALDELVEDYGSTVVLCTATQPAVHRRPEFPIGIPRSPQRQVREIIPDPPLLYRSLKRVDVSDVGAQNDARIAERLRAEAQVLCIVNTRGHAAMLMHLLGEADGLFHLSALMCPAHRSVTLDTIRARLAAQQPCRVVSTQLVEAGVDLDFPVVFRAMAGLDSIAQSAGRCNRNGRLSQPGQVYVFTSEHPDAERFVREAVSSARQALALHPGDPLALPAVERYFRLRYWDQQSRWDSKSVIPSFQLGQDRGFPFLFSFASVARDFRLIDQQTRPVVIPWGAEGADLCSQLRRLPQLHRDLCRRLQRYTVQVRERVWIDNLHRAFEPLFDHSLAVLSSPEMHYSETYGLTLDTPEGQAFFG